MHASGTGLKRGECLCVAAFGAASYGFSRSLPSAAGGMAKK